MKKLLMLAILLSCTGAMARGKLSLQNNLYNDGKTYRPTLGFSVYEPFLKGVALNAYAGAGSAPDEDPKNVRWSTDAHWAVAKVQLDFQGSHKLDGWTISPGLGYKTLIGEEYSDSYGFLRIDKTLW